MAKTKKKTAPKRIVRAKRTPPPIIYLPDRAPRTIKQKDVKRIYASIKNKRSSTHLYQGRICLFFSMNSKFKNCIKDDGFVCGVSDKNQLVPRNIRQPFIASVFVRKRAGQPLEYIGDVKSIVFEDKDHNKMLWG